MTKEAHADSDRQHMIDPGVKPYSGGTGLIKLHRYTGPLSRALLTEEKLYKFMVDNSPDPLYCCDTHGRFIAANQKFCEITGLSQDTIKGKSIYRITGIKKNNYPWIKAIYDLLKDKECKTLDMDIRLPDGSLRAYMAYLTPMLDKDGNVMAVSGTNHDVTEIKKNENEIGHLAHYDLLTDLPNRLLFLEHLNVAIHRADRSGTKIAVIFLDLDNFKKINDTFGHFAGDELIKVVSRELTKCMRREETLARFSGDEFIIFIQNITQPDKILKFIERVKKAFNTSYKVAGHTIYINASIGISVYPEDGTTFEELLKNADAAMYKAKDQGKSNYQFYNRSMRTEAVRRLTLEGHLGNALENGEFFLNYQPLADSFSGNIRGFEALLRWNSPEMGQTIPTDFIRIAEETGLIIPIGEWVLKSACQQNREWFERYGLQTIISVNISPIQLKQNNFASMVKRVLTETKMRPEYLELEITESVLIDSFDDIDHVLHELKALGVKISIDDFGTGFSSLSYLKKLPVSTIKIDKTFIENIHCGNIEMEIIQSVISLVHKFGMKVVAEGVETREQLIYLKEAKCDYLQGFLISHPKDEKSIETLLEPTNRNLLRFMSPSYEGQYI